MKKEEWITKSLLSTLKDDNESGFHKIFIEHAVVREYRKNSFVFYSGENPDAVYFIEKGLLKVCQSTAEGEDVTFFLRKRGEIFGYAEAILEQKRSRFAQCLDHCSIWVLSSQVFLREVLTNEKMNHEILKITNRRLLKQQEMVELLVSQPVSVRLRWLLKELSIPQKGGGYVVKTSLTHSELSHIIGCSRQTVSEILGKWREEGLISYNRKEIFITDVDKMID